MTTAASFGPHLRRIRIRQGVTLTAIAQETKVPVAIWEALEEGNYSGWPSGIYARAYVRDYARIIGADPDETVADFCRLFPQGDRRRARILREQAEIVGHEVYEIADGYRGIERRASSAARIARQELMSIRQRMAVAALDCVTIAAVTAVGSAIVPVGAWRRLALFAALYYGIGLATGEGTPGRWLAEGYLKRRSRHLVATKRPLPFVARSTVESR